MFVRLISRLRNSVFAFPLAALAALAMVLLLGLIGVAVGAHLLGPGDVVSYDYNAKEFQWGAAIFSVFSAFQS